MIKDYLTVSMSVSVFFLTIAGEANPQFDAVARGVDFSSWCGVNQYALSALVDLPALDIGSLTNRIVCSQVNVVSNAVESCWIGTGVHGEELISVHVKLHDETAAAHSNIIWAIAGCTSTGGFSVVDNEIGDRGYINSCSNVMVFARGNIFTQIMTWSGAVSVTEIAREIDGMLLNIATNIVNSSPR